MSTSFKKIIIFLTILILIILFILFRSIYSNQNSVQNRIAKLEKTLDLNQDIFNLTEKNYPDDPYKIALLYLDAYKLIYNDFISNKEVISILLEQQRLLLDESILESTSLKAQKSNLFKSLEYLEEKGIVIKNITTTEPSFTDETENEIVIKATKVDNQGTVYNFNYYLTRDQNNRWKIIKWENDNFTHKIQK